MNSRSSFPPILMACLLAAGFLGLAPRAQAAWPGQSALKTSEGAHSNVIKIKRGARGQRMKIHLPIGPAYIYYDYPYYYSRGHYPTHIGGYVYYPYHLSYYPRYRNRCSSLHRSCVAEGHHYRGAKTPRRKKARKD